MTIVVLRNCPMHGPQSSWHEYPTDLENPRSARVYECDYGLGFEGACGLQLGHPREWVPLAAVLEAVREETKHYSDRPRRVVELVEKRLRRPKGGRR